MNEAAVYNIPSPASGFSATISERFPSRVEILPAHVITYCDTFDWRIHRAGAVLQSCPDGPHTILTWTAGDRQLGCRVEGGQTPGFVWEVPATSLREVLSDVVEMRRLLPVLHVEEEGLLVHILGAEEKTVARVRLLDSKVRVPGNLRTIELPSSLEIIPIKGYETAYERLVAFVEQELGLSQESEPGFQRAARASNISPGDYSSKFRAQLDPAMTMGEAAIAIHKILLGSILANEEGTRQDLDSEFLHDFRVAVRRTRSALSQIKRVFPESQVKHFRKEFAWLGQITGPSRDLDVYLLRMQEYKAILPESVREDLKPLHDFLKVRKQEEHRRLARALESERYRKLLRSWERFLEQPVPSTLSPRNAEEPVLVASSKRITKIYQRILRKGAAIDDESPVSALHKLRIDCKKLRYLLEFFRSLHEDSQIRKLIKSLRSLQDNLGDFNDFEVQQSTLKRFARSMLEEGKGDVETLMAMGRLVERLEAGQQRERKRFSKRFAKFASPANERMVRALFSSERVKLER